MNEFRLDYTAKGEQSILRKRIFLIFGIIVFLIGVTGLIQLFYNDWSLSLTLSTISTTLIGILFLLQALEPKFMFPKKYFYITSEYIEFKLGQFYKEKKIEWDSVNRIEVRAKSVILKSGDSSTRIKMIHFPSSDEKRIKATIHSIALARNITLA